MKDVIIIGTGLAGYTAAHYLAKSNLSVLMLEKSKSVGGRAQTKKISGQYFNMGPHAVYKKGEGAAILEHLGIELHGRSPKLSGEIYEQNDAYTAPFTASGLLASSYLSWKERKEWMMIIMRLSSMKIDDVPQQSYEQWIESNVRSDRVKGLLYALGRLASYCHAPDIISAKVMLAQVKTALGKVLYLDGGWQSLVDQLHNKAVLLDVQIKKESNVQQIRTDEKNGFKLTLSNGEIIYGKHVIYTGEPQALNQMLDVEHPYRDDLSSMKAIKAASLDVALTKLPQPKRLFAMSTTDPLYFAVHSSYAKLSEHGDSIVLHCLKYLRPGEQANNEQVRSELEQFIERLQPGWKNEVITSRFMPSITVNHRLPRANEESPLLQSLAVVPGIYVAGDWASPHSMLLDGAVSSGRLAAEHIIREMR
ncbi:phytoene desaturase family protein [Paenibacillus camelliae]|uniref:phytoene desaturase family protein n=1 Tax=Paenibacillus camelliae TaxID=512410 RepID=UPI00203CB5A9|nr:NAD(P)/FAD-dependent oxidoreductase [Paenibacillus camelliae]MCM3633380.1 NAD(P)/FAD-dependent oxidoreductase [Paenibacillus camelliae]